MQDVDLSNDEKKTALIAKIEQEAKEIIGESESLNLNNLTPFGKGYKAATEKVIQLIEEQESEWTKIEDGLPPKKENEYSDKVLILTESGDVYVNYYDYEWNQWFEHVNGKVTHWMPKPTLPLKNS